MTAKTITADRQRLMRLRLGLIALTLSLLVVAFAAPAHARDSACVWNHLPQETRDKVVALVATDDLKGGMTALTEDRQALGTAGVACGATEQNAVTVGKGLAAYALRVGIGKTLQDRYGAQPERLHALYGALPQADRQRFEADVAAKENTDAEHAFDMDVGRRIAVAAGITDPEAHYRVTMFLMTDVAVAQADAAY